jgi:hypothetical protein
MKEHPQPHWRDKNWQYIPASDHADSTKFRERMAQRRKAAQQQKQPKQ